MKPDIIVGGSTAGFGIWGSFGGDPEILEGDYGWISGDNGLLDI